MCQGIQDITNYTTTTAACDTDASLPGALQRTMPHTEHFGDKENHISSQCGLPASTRAKLQV